MRVLVVSGIWPPDVGGPASHAPDVAGWLQERGHSVEVVTTASAEPARQGHPIHWVSRGLPKGAIHLRTAAVVRRRAAAADVVYTTGMYGRSSGGSIAARRPYVVKLTGDPAFERARWRGLFDGTVEEFQHARGPRIRTLCIARNAELRRAAHVFCPSTWLHELTLSWGVAPDCVSVLPNPSPRVHAVAARAELRRRFGLTRPTLAFAGRLTAQKSLHQALAALTYADGVDLLIAGEGPDREPLEQVAVRLGIAERVRFVGPQPRARVLELLRAADAAILSSAWENFPHMVVEALAVGTPVLATTAGGVGEVVRNGENGLLVDHGDERALGQAITSFFGDDALRARLRAHAATSVDAFTFERVFGELETTLARVVDRGHEAPDALALPSEG
jgi:glycosyltransferase involved in cell wall biosynthesis